MIIVIADTSGHLAALDSAHPEHRAANEAIMAAGLLVMSPLLLAELDHVATRELGREAALGAVDDLRRWMSRGRVVMPEYLCRELSAHFGKAQLFFHSEQNDGEAWLITERGRILRRWISEYPELALGEPFGVERRLLDAYGITGKPEELDPDSDLAGDWAATFGDCWATTVAEESSINPTTTAADKRSNSSMMVAVAPAFE